MKVVLRNDVVKAMMDVLNKRGLVNVEIENEIFVEYTQKNTVVMTIKNQIQISFEVLSKYSIKIVDGNSISYGEWEDLSLEECMNILKEYNILKQKLNLPISEVFKDYEKMIKKYNLYLSDFDILEHSYVITMTENKYEKLGRKHFPKKATETKTIVISARQYACYMTSIGCFGDRVTKTYTQLGYKPSRLVCTSPNKETKIERIFKFEYIN